MSGASTPSSFFVREADDAFLATEMTAGPWDPRVQHGGPPAALLTRAIEAYGDEPEAYALTRVTSELLRPVPIDVLRVEVSLRRGGRRVQWLEATLSHDGREVGRATAVRILRSEQDVPPARCPRLTPMPPPEAAEPFVFPFFRSEVGYHLGVETRLAEGPWSQGPAAMWIRPAVPLVEGETPSPMQCVMLAADASNGVCPALDTNTWAFINPDLTVHVCRPPKGRWVGLRARSIADPGGTGLVDAEIHDEHGELGRAALSLVVGPRPR